MGTISYLIGVAIALYASYWIYTDAEKRGMPAIAWAIGNFLCFPIVLIIYLIMRKPLGTPSV